MWCSRYGRVPGERSGASWVFPAAPSVLHVGGEGPQRLCTTAAAAGAVPASTWLRLCRLFPPDICVPPPPPRPFNPLNTPHAWADATEQAVGKLEGGRSPPWS